MLRRLAMTKKSRLATPKGGFDRTGEIASCLAMTDPTLATPTGGVDKKTAGARCTR